MFFFIFSRNASKPASLNRDRLDEQIREQRQLHADIMSHQVSFMISYQKIFLISRKLYIYYNNLIG